MEFEVPDKSVFVPKMNELLEGWDALPPSRVSQEYGTQLLQSGILCFGVPSIVDKTYLNFVINPLSANFSVVSSKVYHLNLDLRIIR
jgi:hypothetical protein